MSVCLFVNRGCVGTAWFDDASVTPVDGSPVVPATMSVRVWTGAGRTYQLACNLTREDVAGDIWLSGWHADCRDLLGGIASEVDGGRVPVTLPPLGVGLFALTD